MVVHSGDLQGVEDVPEGLSVHHLPIGKVAEGQAGGIRQDVLCRPEQGILPGRNTAQKRLPEVNEN